ncbi:MAG: histidine phosphatase family protein [Anaerolineae bacterium]|nr:histidine phosphatase family protein [Anaerolineae bacterium]
MKPIILVRHAQSQHHVNGLTGGWTDTGLTDLGRRQAACLASRLKHELEGVPVRFCCSDLKRALQTAEIVGREIGVTAQLVPGLREFNNGVAAGMLREEADKIRREPAEPFIDWQPYPEAETWRQFYGRVAKAMDHLIEEQEELLLLVTHGGALVNIVAWWLQLDGEMLSKVSFNAHPTAISVLYTDQWGSHELERLNDTAHLYAAGLAESLLPS